MIRLRPSTRTLICIGSGGVGKTTMSASVAVGLASAGQKVLVLTIDPSRRLAEALGIRTDGELYRVPLPAEAGAAKGARGPGGQNEGGGELWSCVIDHRRTFEWFLKNASGQDAGSVNRLLQNRLYQQLSGRLSGSQEFTSLVSLYRFVSSGEYDLVILDTPPSQHTWNFLKAPEKIAALFNEGVASWFRGPGDDDRRGVFKKILNLGTTQVLKALETLTGSQFMKELSAFFQAIQKWQGPLEKYIMDCHRLLAAPETEFILVTALDSARIVEAQKLSREIQKQGYRLTGVIINRIPEWVSKQHGPAPPRLQEILDYYKSLESDLQSRLSRFKHGLNVYKCPELRQNSEDVATLLENYKRIRPLE